MCNAQALSVQGQPGVMTFTYRHRNQRKRVRSVRGRCEDSCDVIISVAHVTDDVVKENFLSLTEGNSSGELNVEGDLCGKKNKKKKHARSNN